MTTSMLCGIPGANDMFRVKLVRPRKGPLSATTPGPGGSQVPFERIVFLDHLIGFNHNVIKEYVRVRADTLKGRADKVAGAEIAGPDAAERLTPLPAAGTP
ncbi:hypothetical protein F4776DRAFT_140495 [Hypoxylon sp. NC0597]|nr:hypothetical protein F4776DRAFT_140495 [Hypoxylon sp. NC0597]